MLVKVRAEGAARIEIVNLAKVMNCNIVDSTETTILLEHSDRPEKMDVLINMLSSYEIIDMARGGAIALKKGE